MVDREKTGPLPADHVVAGVHVVDLAGHAAGQVADQVEAGLADFLRLDIPPQRALGRVVVEDLVEAADAGRAERPAGAGADRVDAHAAKVAEVGREIANRALQRGLADAHDVVAGDELDRAEVAEGEDRCALAEHVIGLLTGGDQRVTTDVHGLLEILPAGFPEPVGEAVAIGEGDGVDQEVDLVVAVADLIEKLLDVVVGADVAGEDELCSDGVGELFDPPLHLLARQMVERDLRAFLMEV